jgi:hypothetical protein
MEVAVLAALGRFFLATLHSETLQGMENRQIVLPVGKAYQKVCYKSIKELRTSGDPSSFLCNTSFFFMDTAV